MFEHYNVYNGKDLLSAEKAASKKPFGKRLPLIEWLEKEYGFDRPVSVDLNGFIFPSKLAEEWLHYALNMLGIKY